MKPTIVECGPLRSERELTLFLQIQARCAACSGSLVTHVREKLPPGSPHVVVLPSTCRTCGRAYDLAFTAGPSFDRRPPAEDPRLALTDAPSALVPEQHFRRQSSQLLRALEAEKDPASRKLWASACLSDFLELEKFARARGEQLIGEDALALRRCARAFIANGGILPADLAPRFVEA